jgi:IclR family mhp operon transcriptional activator
LQAEGYARPEQPAGTWRLAARARELGGGYTEGHALIDQGRNLLLETTRQIKWPLALGLLEVDAIVVRFSSMPYSPLAVHTTTLGHRLSLLESAMGRAYLAFCGETTRDTLLHELGLGEDTSDKPLRRWVLHDLRQVAQAGWAVRQPNAERGTATLAVPVCAPDEDALAVLGMTTFGKAMTPTVISQHVPLLQATALRLAALTQV